MRQRGNEKKKLSQFNKYQQLTFNLNQRNDNVFVGNVMGEKKPHHLMYKMVLMMPL